MLDLRSFCLSAHLFSLWVYLLFLSAFVQLWLQNLSLDPPTLMFWVRLDRTVKYLINSSSVMSDSTHVSQSKHGFIWSDKAAVKLLFLLLFNLHNKGMNTYFDICCVIMFSHRPILWIFACISCLWFSLQKRFKHREETILDFQGIKGKL